MHQRRERVESAVQNEHLASLSIMMSIIAIAPESRVGFLILEKRLVESCGDFTRVLGRPL